MSSPESVEAACDGTVAAFGSLEVAVNCAGIVGKSHTGERERERERENSVVMAILPPAQQRTDMGSGSHTRQLPSFPPFAWLLSPAVMVGARIKAPGCCFAASWRGQGVPPRCLARRYTLSSPRCSLSLDAGTLISALTPATQFFRPNRQKDYGSHGRPVRPCLQGKQNMRAAVPCLPTALSLASSATNTVFEFFLVLSSENNLAVHWKSWLVGGLCVRTHPALACCGGRRRALLY